MPTRFFSTELHTLRNVRRDFPEWHRGRPRYALWAIDVDQAAVRQRVQSAQEHLAGLLLADYRRQAHVTLSLCGFPSRFPELADDFGAGALQAQLDALQAARPACFQLEIGGLASFSSAPFLTVRDPDDGIAQLRRALAIGDLNGLKADYLPHVTVGLYADAWPRPAVHARLSSFAAGDPLCIAVRRVSLMSYAASDIGGRLEPLVEYDCERATLHWHDSPWPGLDQPD